jgi:hypothetical protein
MQELDSAGGVALLGRDSAQLKNAEAESYATLAWSK